MVFATFASAVVSFASVFTAALVSLASALTATGALDAGAVAAGVWANAAVANRVAIRVAIILFMM